MPSQETAFRTQYAVLWPATGNYDAYGQPTIGSPVEIKVRWVSGESRAMDKQGNNIVLDGKAVVNRDIPLGSLMWEGRIRDLRTPEGLMFDPILFDPSFYDPGDLPGTLGVDIDVSKVMEVKTFNPSKDIKGRATYREVGLMRFRSIVGT